MTDNDPYSLSRFVNAQETIFERVLAELISGQKRSHWMWFIFPQIEGLGNNPTSRYYAIKSLDEAREYLNHPVLGPRLVQCAEAVLAIQGKSASEIFGFPDDLKLMSSMTLFACVTDFPSVFGDVLEKYFDGKRDKETLKLLGYDINRE
jgi:uncharacterized protein (DUF1810 family)